MSLPADMLLKAFQTKEHDYLFCARSNQIFMINPVMLEILPLYWELSVEAIHEILDPQFTAAEVAASYQIIDSLARERGFFRRGGLTERTAGLAEETLREELSRDLQQLSLEVTEVCNLRCHYCIYSGGYDYGRTHGKRSMTPEIARAAVDFLFRLNRDTEDPFSLSFYGGEPLLEFDLIRDTIEYARSLPWAHPESLLFSLTTNGTMLSEEVSRFLITHQARVLVSLDGPEPDHDAHRVRRDGSGTFAQVIANIRRLRQLGCSAKHLSVNCVITPTADIDRLNQFFVELGDDVRTVSPSAVSPGHASFFAQYPGNGEAQLAQHRALFQRYVEAHLEDGPPIPERPELRFITPQFQRDFITLHKRAIFNSAPQSINSSATCTPGKRKLFVDTGGTFHICERISNTCPIGDVHRGFDLPAVKRLADQYTALMNRSRCRSCWALLFCPACFANMAGDGLLTEEQTDKLCGQVRASMEGALRSYCTVLDRKPDAFDYLDEIEVA